MENVWMKVGRWTIYVLVLLVFTGPYWGLVMTAISEPLVKPGTLLLVPEDPTLRHLRFAWEHAHAWRYLLNSCIVVAVGTLLQVIVSALAAYALARKKFAGSSLISLLILSTLMLPEEVIAIPLYIVLGKLPLLNVSLLDSYLGMILPVVGWAFSIFVLTEFMRAIPIELEEAARVDGANEFQIFYKVVLPLVKPALSTVTVFGFIMIWDQYLLPLIVVNDAKLYTLPVILGTLRVDETIAPNAFIAITLMAMVPSIVMYLALRTSFNRGLMVGAVKG